MEEEKRGRGRPSLPPEERRNKFLRVRLSAAELEEIRAVAEERGESVSDYARGVVLRSVKRAKGR